MIDSSSVTHDIFISYSHRDAGWVVEELQPQLEAGGLSVLRDEKDFDYGEFATESMVAVVRKARHFVAVITEDWLNSPWCQFEQGLQLTKDPTGKVSRLIPLVFVPHDKLPLLYQGLNYADCTTIEKRGKSIARLLLQLGMSQQQIDKTNAQFAEKGLGELRMLMKTPAVADASVEFFDSLSGLRDEIKRLGQFKTLHDYFQRAEDHYKLAFMNLQLVKVDARDWDDLESSADLLSTELEHLLRFAGSFLPASERTWSEKLAIAQRRLARGIGEQKAKSLQRPMEWFRESFGREPLRLNDRIVAVAAGLHLPELVEILQSIGDRVEQMDFDDVTSRHLNAFRGSLVALCVLANSLAMLVNHHHILQGLDSELRRYNFLAGVTRLPANDIVDDWLYLKEVVAKLNGDANSQPKWLKSLGKIRDSLSTRCASNTSDLSEALIQKVIRKEFNRFNNAVTEGLTCVDTDLMNLCDRLQDVGDELGKFLGDNENG